MEEKKDTIVAGQITGDKTESGNPVHNADGTFGSGTGNSDELNKEDVIEKKEITSGINDFDWDDIDGSEFSFANDVMNETFENTLNLIEGEHSLFKDCENINPNHSYSDKKYSHNCTHCIFSYELRRRGYDVEATAIDLDYDPYRYGAWRYMFIDENGNYAMSEGNSLVNASRKEDLFVKIMDKMKEIPNGRFVCRCSWSFGSGHVFNLETKDGEFFLIESQTGESYIGLEANKILKTHYIENSQPTKFELFRVDNCEINWPLMDRHNTKPTKNKKSKK